MGSQRMPEAVWLGLDLGTESVCAMLVSETGDIIGIGSEKLNNQRSGGKHEQIPDEWWSAASAACRAALASLPGDSRVAGAAVDGTPGTILLADPRGRPLTPGLMYDDTRAVDEAKSVNEVGATVWQMPGYNRMQASWGLPKLLWLGGEDPRNAAARAIEVLYAIASAHRDGRVLVVSHNTLICLALCSLFGIPLARYQAIFPKVINCAPTEIRFRDKEVALLRYNSDVAPIVNHQSSKESQ